MDVLSKIYMTDFLDWYFQDNPDNPRPDNWDEIETEYIDRQHNSETDYLMGLRNDINVLRNSQFIVGEILTVLMHVYSADLVHELRIMGYRGTFNYRDQEKYFKDIVSVDNQAKRLVHQIEKKEMELEAYLKKMEGKQVDRAHFESKAINFSMWLKFHISFEGMTVSRWCAYAVKYDKYLEVMNAESNNLIKTGYNG